MRIRLVVLFLCFTFPLTAQNLDLNIYDNIHGQRNSSLDGVMNGVSISAYPIALAVPLGQFIYSFAKHDDKSIENAAQTVGALAIATSLTLGLKYIINRDRPYITHPQYTPYEWDKSPSFPSGHTSLAFATATSVSLQYKKWYVVTPAFLYAGAVGYSRVHLGSHYPSDVLLGAIIGAGSSFASYKINHWLRKKWIKGTKENLLD